MHYLGIDASLTKTGVVVLDEKGKIKYQGTIRPKTFGWERLAYIEREAEEILLDHTVNMSAMEDGSFGSVGHVADLGKVRGILGLSLYRHRIRCVSVAPTTLKKWVTGSGRGEKSDMKLAIYKRWGVTFKDEDEADAYGLATIAHAIGTERKDLSEYEMEVVKRLTTT